jgi:hypothetical protein
MLCVRRPTSEGMKDNTASARRREQDERDAAESDRDLGSVPKYLQVWVAGGSLALVR